MSASPDVLVIGGTGLMGAPTARLLQVAGHRVVVMSRGSPQGQGSGGQRPEQAACEFLQCDREDTAQFVEMLTSSQCPRVIVDFTAMSADHIEVYPGGVEDMDITGLPQPVAEDAADLAGADGAPDTYGGRKLKCEALLGRAYKDEGLPSTTLRPPAVVGPGCDNRHERLHRLVAGLPPLPPPPTTRPPPVNPGFFRVAHCSDVAAAVAAVVTSGKSVHGEAFNVASSESITLQDYVAAIGAQLGRVPPDVPSDQALRSYERQGQLDVSKAERILGFRPTPLAKSIGDTVAWHASHL